MPRGRSTENSNNTPKSQPTTQGGLDAKLDKLVEIVSTVADDVNSLKTRVEGVEKRQGPTGNEFMASNAPEAVMQHNSLIPMDIRVEIEGKLGKDVLI